MKFLYLISGLWKYLSRRRRIQLCVLLILMFSSGIAELVSLGAVIPLLSMLSSPQTLLNNNSARSLATFFHITTFDQISFTITVLFVISAITAAFIRLVNLRLNLNFAAAVGSDLSCQVYAKVLYQPYSVQIRTNSSEVINSITAETDQTVAAISCFLQMITSFVVAISLFIGLIIIDFVLACSAALVFLFAYLAIAKFSRTRLTRNSSRIVSLSSSLIKLLQEGLGAIRDVILESSQPIYIDAYEETDRPRRRLVAENQFLGASPRFLLEAVVLVAIALISYFLIDNGKPSQPVLPLLGALALGAQRLLPLLQQMYASWSFIKSSTSQISSILEKLALASNTLFPNKFIIPFKKHIQLKNLYFSYDSSKTNLFKNLSLTIFKGDNVGLVGHTGSGKSTIVDILMGLLKPTTGDFLIDGQNLYSDSAYHASWMSSIAHVPQHIFLADCSIARNIAFGIGNSSLDMERVISASKIAHIFESIQDMPDGFDTVVGERGVRLSGGQRQRIGIARAMYKKANLLILDEATSALDHLTERAVIASIQNLDYKPTIIMIAHRLSTLSHCNRVIKIKDGKIVMEGSPSEVLYREH